MTTPTKNLEEALISGHAPVAEAAAPAPAVLALATVRPPAQSTNRPPLGGPLLRPPAPRTPGPLQSPWQLAPRVGPRLHQDGPSDQG